MKTSLVLLWITLFCIHADAQEIDPPGAAHVLAEIREKGGRYERAVVYISAPRSYTDDDLPKLGVLRRHLQRLSLRKTAITDHGLRDILGFTELRALNLGATRITDDVVEHLAKLPRLRQLFLGQTALTGARFHELGKLEELSLLDLSESKVNHEGLKQLKALPSLKILWLADMEVDHRGVAELRHVAHLEELRLDGTSIDNRGVAELKHVHLKQLHLDRTRIEGHGGMDAAWAQGLPNLSDLRLSRTRVDDRCIPALASLPRLEGLAIHQTRITPAGLCKFAQLRRRDELVELPFWLAVSPEQLTEQVSVEFSKTFEDVKYQVMEDER
jgi:hypothetical protein